MTSDRVAANQPEDEEVENANVVEQRITRMAYRPLSDCGYHELTRISCEYRCEGRVLVLRGRVSSFYMKQLAQTAVMVIEHVYEIENHVDVVYRT